jgi:hypothetical protein
MRIGRKKPPWEIARIGDRWPLRMFPMRTKSSDRKYEFKILEKAINPTRTNRQRT